MDHAYECALITGASSGLGEEFVKQLAPRLDRVVLVARRRDRLQDLAAWLQERFEVEVLVITADVSSPQERERVLREVESREWTVDLLVNNAGLGDYGEFGDSDWPRNEAMIRVNVEALTHLTHLFLPAMLAQEGGAVVNVSSLASTLPIPDFAVYAATKAYVSSFSEALRLEVRGRGVEVLAVCPGPVPTEFGEVAARAEDRVDMPGGRDALYVQREQVVAESLQALGKGAARIYPSKKITLMAFGISLLPMVAVRLIMSSRPRRKKSLQS